MHVLFSFAHYKNKTSNLKLWQNIVKVRTQQQQKQAWYIQEVKDIRGVTENSTNTEVAKIPSRRKGESHRDAFRNLSPKKLLLLEYLNVT